MHKQQTPKKPSPSRLAKSKTSPSSHNRHFSTSKLHRKNRRQSHHPLKTTKTTSRHFSSLGFSWPVSKQLDGVVNLERFALQEPSMIDQLWSDYHAASSTATGFSIDSMSFEKLKQRGPNTEYFIHPIPRDDGYFVMLTQYQDKSFLVTYLEDYKQNPMNAQPYMTITLYDELQHSKDLVLVRGDVCALATMTKQESDVLARTIIASYADDGMYTNVFTFNKQPDQFNFDNYVKQVVTNSDV